MVDEKVVYAPSDFDRLGTKGKPFQFGTEIIVFSPTHQLVQHCHYVGEERRCPHEEEYRIGPESTLAIRKGNQVEEWHYQRQADSSYRVCREFDGTLECGQTERLIPLEAEKWTTTSSSGKDTLWTTEFVGGHHKLVFYKTPIDEKIHEYNEIDDPPRMRNGEALEPIVMEDVLACLSSPLMDIGTVAVVVTAEGEIVNVEQALGSIPENCPYTLQTIIRALQKWGRVVPARKNDRAVAVRWFVTIDNLSRKQLHPLLIDNEENRKAYLRRKRKEGRGRCFR